MKASSFYLLLAVLSMGTLPWLSVFFAFYAAGYCIFLWEAQA